MLNKIPEIFGIFRFIKLKPLHEYLWFQELLTGKLSAQKERGKAVDALAKLLGMIMLRRKKGQEVLRNGRKEKLLEIEQAAAEVRVPMDPEQAAAYAKLYRLACDAEERAEAEKQTKKTSSSTAEGQQKSSHLGNPMTMITRLRQLCQSQAMLPPELLDYLQKTSAESIDLQRVEEIFVKFGQREKFWLETFTERDECPICFEDFDEIQGDRSVTVRCPVMLECGHVLCVDCIHKWKHTCPECRQPFDKKKAKKRPEDYLEQMKAYQEKEEKRKKTKHADAAVDVVAASASSAHVQVDADPKTRTVAQLLRAKFGGRIKLRLPAHAQEDRSVTHLPSQAQAQRRDEGMLAEMDNALVNEYEGRCGAADGKVVIFSEFREQLQLLQTALFSDEHSELYTVLDGTMTVKEQRSAIEAFQEQNAKPLVMFATKTVAAFGLTLTAADCVVLLHPFWNEAAESQALDRVRRLGSRFDRVCSFKLIATAAPPDTDPGGAVMSPRRQQEEAETTVIEEWLCEWQVEKKNAIAEGLGDKNKKKQEPNDTKKKAADFFKKARARRDAAAAPSPASLKRPSSTDHGATGDLLDDGTRPKKRRRVAQE
ncbi:unnamed protein product [Amoebophrya sp. A120]|nr:unnamed protein product [Amoebophrya sp. A120]|eukprot:GSA120T00002676001.1